MSDLQQQLEDLQFQVAYQENTITELNDIVTRQDGELRLLQRQLELISAKLKTVDSGGDKTIDNEVPPHY